MDIFEPIMKIGLFSLILMLVILRPTVPFAQKAKEVKDFTLSQEESQPYCIYSQDKNFNLDDNLIDLSDDDVNDTERKNLPSQKIPYRTIFSLASQLDQEPSNRNWVSGYSFRLPSSLYILHRVLRV